MNLFKTYLFILIAGSLFLSCTLKRDNALDINNDLQKGGLAVLTTTPISSINQNSATGGGNITNEGATIIIAKGVCWSIYPAPTITQNKTIDGTGIGYFTSSISGLSANTTFYIRAYATNSAGTAYGNELSFTTSSAPLGLPTIITTTPGAITQTTAQSGGNVTNDRGAAIVARGVCWNIFTSPTVTLNTKTIDGTGIGNFTSNLTGLTANTTYYVRAYATNSEGTAYGNEFCFNTPGGLPTISTTTPGSITQTTAQSGGNITNDGGSIIVARGVCWDIFTSPTVALSTKTIDGTGIGSFTSNLTGLTLNTKYYIRAYATNSEGTAYGAEMSITTLPTNPTVGQSYGGGIIAYILQPSDPGYSSFATHGLIAAPSDQSTGIQWYNGIYNITPGASGIDIGTGLNNTNAIIAALGAGTYAASICKNITIGGYNDWYLPSKNELNKLFINRALINGFSTVNYWSSTEDGAYFAWCQDFDFGTIVSTGKVSTFRVRAIRSF